MSLKRFRLMTADEKEQAYREIMERCILLGDCWVYPVVNSKGYGMRRIHGKIVCTSRFVLAYHTRESMNIKLDACHVGECPYRACCNPRHLEWGTHSENALQREQEARKAQFDFRWAIDPRLGHETHEEHDRWLAELSTSDPVRLQRIHTISESEFAGVDSTVQHFPVSFDGHRAVRTAQIPSI